MVDYGVGAWNYECRLRGGDMGLQKWIIRNNLVDYGVGHEIMKIAIYKLMGMMWWIMGEG